MDGISDKVAAAVASAPATTIRQVDLRRAISTAYYAHYLTAAVADEFIGSTQRATLRYARVYRCVDHRALKDFCLEARKSTPSRQNAAYVHAVGFGPDIQVVADAVVTLQERRHLADYDPQPRFRRLDASLAIATAQSAIASSIVSIANENGRF